MKSALKPEIDNSIKKLQNILGIFLIMAPVIVYYGFVHLYALNIPYWDEYREGLSLLNEFTELDFPNNVLLLFRQHNEHRMFAYHLHIVLQYFVGGELNFRQILIVGNLGMLGLGWLLYLLNPGFRKEPLAFAPVILLLFTPMMHITNWTATIKILLQLFVLSSLFLLQKKNTSSFIFSLLLAMVATFSFGNGMFTFVTGFIILLLNPVFSWRRVSIWALVMVISVALFFTGYHMTGGGGDGTTVFAQPVKALSFFLAFFSKPFVPILAVKAYLWIAAGFSLMIAFLYLIYLNRTQLSQHRVAFAYMLFVVISAAAASYSRFGDGIGIALSNRYALYAVLFLAMTYIVAWQTIRPKSHLTIMMIIGFSMVLYLTRVETAQEEFENHETALKSGMACYHLRIDSADLLNPNYAFSTRMLHQAKEKSHYSPPEIKDLFPEIKKQDNLKWDENLNHVNISVETFTKTDKGLFVKGWGFNDDVPGKVQNIVVVFVSKTDTVIFSTVNQQRLDIRNKFQGSYKSLHRYTGFYAFFDEKMFRPTGSDYALWVGFEQDGTIAASHKTDHHFVW